jgi:hypothetical protein
MLFPKRNASNLKGATGQSYFSNFVNEYLECIYHAIIQENDFGIDGYIELVINQNVTGKLVGVQLKHGDSFFKKENEYGYQYVGENKHLNYYLNNTLPIFIIIMDEAFHRLHWVLFDVSKTMPFGANSWWIEIPKKNELKFNFKSAIFDSSTPVVDFKKQVQWHWDITSVLQNHKFRVIAVPQDEILKMRFDSIWNFIDNLSTNHELLVSAHSSLDIFFPEYSHDTREIFQIPEILAWLNTSVDRGIPWFYFLDYHYKNAGLHLLTHSYCRSEYIGMDTENNRHIFNYNGADLRGFIEKNLVNMNLYMKKNSLRNDLNVEISDGVIQYFKTHLI